MTPFFISGGVYLGVESAVSAGALNGICGISGPAAGGLAAGATAGGLNSLYYGGNISDAMLTGALYGGIFASAVDGLSSAATYMRNQMIEQSKLNPQNASGKSAGFKGDGVKIGGGRWVEGVDEKLQRVSPLGGQQGGVGRLFGFEYSPGSIWDRVVEAFGGPHDYLNNWYWYNSSGNAIPYTGLAKYFGEALNVANVFIASPFVAASVTPPYLIPAAMNSYDSRRR